MKGELALEGLCELSCGRVCARVVATTRATETTLATRSAGSSAPGRRPGHAGSRTRRRPPSCRSRRTEGPDDVEHFGKGKERLSSKVKRRVMLRPATPSAKIIAINFLACRLASRAGRCAPLPASTDAGLSPRPAPSGPFPCPSSPTSRWPRACRRTRSPRTPRGRPPKCPEPPLVKRQHGSPVSVIIDHAFQVFVDSCGTSKMMVMFCRLFS